MTLNRSLAWRVATLALLLAACLPARLGADEKKPDEKLQEQALKLNHVTGKDPIQGQILKLIKDEENSKKLLAVAAKMAQGKDQPFNVNATYVLARTARALRDYDNAEVFFRINIKQGKALWSAKKQAESLGDLIEILYLNRKYKEAEQVCVEFLNLEGDAEVERQKLLVLRTMIRTQARQGKTKEALGIVDRLIKSDPKNWLHSELRGLVLREAGRYDESVKTYQDVIGRIEKDDRLKDDQKKLFINDVRYTLSGVFIDWKKIDEAAGELQKLIEAEKDNPTYYNDLGYIWADHDMKLDESEKLIRKAIEMDRAQKKKSDPKAEVQDNAAYLDSLGWVLFKKKQYKEALQPFLDAVKQEDGKHVEIYDHLGEVYWQLGQKEKALEAWKTGLECKELSSRDKKMKEAVKKKLEERSKEK